MCIYIDYLYFGSILMVGLYIPDLGYVPNKYFVHVHGLDSFVWYLPTNPNFKYPLNN